MKWARQLYGGVLVLAVIASACGETPMPDVTEEAAMPDVTQQAQASGEPVFEVDPLWPKALPEDWMFGNVVGVAVDSQDNVWIAHRPRSQNGSEGTPHVLAFDQDGNVVKSWGGQDAQVRHLRVGYTGARAPHRLPGQRLGRLRRWPTLRQPHAGNHRQRPFPEALARRRAAPCRRRIRDGHRGQQQHEVPSRLLKNSAKWDRQIDPVVLRCSQH